MPVEVDAVDPPVHEMEAVALSAYPALESSCRPSRTMIEAIPQGAATGNQMGGKKVVGGRVKTRREQGKRSFAFLELNDSSCLASLEVIVDASVFPLLQVTPTGTSVLVDGTSRGRHRRASRPSSLVWRRSSKLGLSIRPRIRSPRRSSPSSSFVPAPSCLAARTIVPGCPHHDICSCLNQR